jgi:hypothetical protein
MSKECIYFFGPLYVYIYIYIHTHTHIYIYIYIYICTVCRSVEIPSEAWYHVTLWRLLSSWICRRFGGTWSLPLQSTSTNIAALTILSKSPTTSITTPALRMPFAISCIFVPEWLNFLTLRWRQLVSPKRKLLIIQRHISEANAHVCLVTILTFIVDTMSMFVCLTCSVACAQLCPFLTHVCLCFGKGHRFFSREADGLILWLLSKWRRLEQALCSK